MLICIVAHVSVFPISISLTYVMHMDFVNDFSGTTSPGIFNVR